MIFILSLANLIGCPLREEAAENMRETTKVPKSDNLRTKQSLSDF